MTRPIDSREDTGFAARLKAHREKRGCPLRTRSMSRPRRSANQSSPRPVAGRQPATPGRARAFTRDDQ